MTDAFEIEKAASRARVGSRYQGLLRGVRFALAVAGVMTLGGCVFYGHGYRHGYHHDRGYHHHY